MYFSSLFSRIICWEKCDRSNFGLKLWLTGDSGNEIGPFKAIEESTLAHLTPSSDRNDVYAWYALLGSTGTACGMMTCGWVVQYLQSVRGWDEARSYRVIFIAYSLLGAVKFCISCFLSGDVEVKKISKSRISTRDEPSDESESEALLPDSENDVELEQKAKGKWKFSSLLPDISPESRVIVMNLCILFGLDSFASGVVAMYVPFFAPFAPVWSLILHQDMGNILLQEEIRPLRQHARLHLLRRPTRRRTVYARCRCDCQASRQYKGRPTIHIEA